MEITKERLSYARVNEILRARLRRELVILSVMNAEEVLLLGCMLLCCHYLEWHPLAIAMTAFGFCLMAWASGFWYVNYFKARALVKNARYRIVTDTLSHVVEDRYVRPRDMNYKRLLSGNVFGGRYLTEVWFNTYGCVRVSSTALRYPFPGELYYLVVTDEAPYEVIRFFDAKYYDLKEDAPAVR